MAVLSADEGAESMSEATSTWPTRPSMALPEVEEDELRVEQQDEVARLHCRRLNRAPQ